MHLSKDIEDLQKVCAKTRAACSGSCSKTSTQPIHIKFKDTTTEWHKVFDLPSLFYILSRSSFQPYILIGGNTAHGESTRLETRILFSQNLSLFAKKGVYRRKEDLELFIDVHDVVELRSHSLNHSLVIGANVTLNEAIQIFMDASKTFGFEYCKRLAQHVERVANFPVRDVSRERNKKQP